jgi:dTDP-4-amino-4,6-dideoxygalactose transaminase
VITPSFTYIATVEVVALLGLRPVFVDVDINTFTMDPESLRKAITSKTRAIIPVHLYGQTAPMEEILAIGKEFGIPVIEDNAQAIGGDYTFANGPTVKNGTMGRIGTTSFFPSKNLGCYGDGGALFTNDRALFEKMTMIANHGQKERYYHEMVGCNSRLDSIQAAILRIKLRNLDTYCDARRSAADYYDRAFASNEWIKTPSRSAYSRHVFHQYTLQLSDRINRDEIKKQLEERGIPSMIYYPVPCHKQKMFADLGGGKFELPYTDYLTPRVLSLPIHTELTDAELQFIAENVNELVNQSASQIQ